MNKCEFLRRLSLETGLSVNMCSQVLKSGVEIVKSELNTGGEVVFRDFGRIFAITRGERFFRIDKREFLVPARIETKIKLFRGFKNIVK